MRLVYTKSAVANTTTITNIGNIKMDELYAPYVKGFKSFIAMSKGQEIKGTICSYQDTLVFTFSSVFAEALVQKAFFRKIAADEPADKRIAAVKEEVQNDEPVSA